MSRDTLDLRLIVRHMVDEACERLAADAVALWLCGSDGSELTLTRAVGFQQPSTAMQLAHRPSARVGDWLVARRLPAVVTLKRADAAGDRAWLAAEEIHSVLAVPIPAGETSLGILAAFRRRRPFPVGYLARAAGMAATTAPAVHAAQRLEEQRERAERAEALLDVAQVLAASRDLDAAIATVAARTARALGAAHCHVSFSRPTQPTEPPVASASILVVPIAGKDDVLGSLTLAGAPPAGWTPAAVELATGVAAQVALAADTARLHAGARQGETLRALAELASGAAHHLNNLLTIVVGRVQLVLRAADDERIVRPLTIVEKAAKDGAEVVRRLQQFSRMRAVGQPRPVSVEHLLRDVLALLDSRWRRPPPTTVEVETRFGDVLPIAGDAAALREALTNIVANAMEAMPNGGRLLAETRASEDEAHIAITDTGVGMSPSVQLRAPEPFFTTKGVKATGLGLSVAYGIVRSHGGDIAIRSTESAGTTVTITLPRPVRTAPPATPPLRTGALRVLLVDDETDVRDALADMLASQGHVVLTAAGGAEALAIVDREPALDVVLTDVVMPGMSGWDVAAEAKARRPHIAVGVVTGWGDPMDVDTTPRHGIDFVLDKPVTLEILKEALARLRPR